MNLLFQIKLIICVKIFRYVILDLKNNNIEGKENYPCNNQLKA